MEIPAVGRDRKVQCPHCKAEYLIGNKIAADPPPLPPPAPSNLPSLAEAIYAETPPALPMAVIVDEEDDAERPRRQRRLQTEEEEEDDRPRRRRIRRDPQDAVRIPAVVMQILVYSQSVLNICASLFVEYLAVVLGGTDGPEAPSTAQLVLLALGPLVGCVITYFWARFLLDSAFYMARLQHLEMAIAGCIFAMVPCLICFGVAIFVRGFYVWGLLWFGGVPVGIWCLVVILQEDVQKAFT
jgi:hypothetical protein